MQMTSRAEHMLQSLSNRKVYKGIHYYYQHEMQIYADRDYNLRRCVNVSYRNEIRNRKAENADVYRGSQECENAQSSQSGIK